MQSKASDYLGILSLLLLLSSLLLLGRLFPSVKILDVLSVFGLRQKCVQVVIFMVKALTQIFPAKMVNDLV